MTEQDHIESLRSMFSNHEPVFELEPLLRALENEGIIHAISCEEAIMSSLFDLKNHGTKESFADSWNVVSHIAECDRRACCVLRTFTNTSHIAYPTQREYIQIEQEVQAFFMRDRIEEGLNSNEAQILFECLMPKE